MLSYWNLSESQKHVLSTVLGILSLVILIGFGLLAYLNSPNYDPLVHTISKLGIQTAEGSLYFTISTVLGGSFLLAYFLINKDIFPFHSHRMFKDKSLTSWSHYFTISGSVFLILVGLFPDRGITVIPHFLVAAAMFTCIGIAIFIWSLTLWEDYSQEISSARPVALLGFFTCIIALMHGFFSSIKFHGPIWQKTAVFFYVVWFFVFHAWKVKVLNATKTPSAMPT